METFPLASVTTTVTFPLFSVQTAGASIMISALVGGMFFSITLLSPSMLTALLPERSWVINVLPSTVEFTASRM